MTRFKPSGWLDHPEDDTRSEDLPNGGFVIWKYSNHSTNGRMNLSAETWRAMSSRIGF